MPTLKETAQAYEPPKTKNIADLEYVDITEAKIETGEGETKEGKKFKYFFFKKDGEEYRVPNKVVGDIKAFLKKMPSLKYVAVVKQGEGMATTYNTLPWTPETTTTETPQAETEKVE